MATTKRKQAATRARMKVTTIALPSALHRSMLVAALNTNTAVTEIVRDAVAAWLSRTGKRRGSSRVLVPRTMWDYAGHYLAAARVLLRADRLDAVSFHPVLPHLLGHSIETSLKAFLSARGVTEDELRDPKRFGHDLMKLLSAARRYGLDEHVHVTARERRALVGLNRLYASRALVYSSNAAGEWVRKTPPRARPLVAVAEKLHRGVRAVCSPVHGRAARKP